MSTSEQIQLMYDSTLLCLIIILTDLEIRKKFDKVIIMTYLASL